MSPQNPGAPVPAIVGWMSRLRFPQLFLVTGILFVVDLIIPDLIPFADELLLGLLTLLLGSLQRKKEPEGPKPPMKDVTPRD